MKDVFYRLLVHFNSFTTSLRKLLMKLAKSLSLKTVELLNVPSIEGGDLVTTDTDDSESD